MDMHTQMKIPEPQYRGLCKILLLVCVALMVVFFIGGFLSYFNYQAGDTINLRGFEYTVSTDETFSLMSLLGFPDDYELVSGFKKAGEKADVFKYKVMNVMDIGPFLFLMVFSVLMTVLIILKKTKAKAFICVVWGLVGTITIFVNCVFRMGNTWVRPLYIVLVIAELLVSGYCYFLYTKDSRMVAKYLREQSDVYK